MTTKVKIDFTQLTIPGLQPNTQYRVELDDGFVRDTLPNKAQSPIVPNLVTFNTKDVPLLRLFSEATPADISLEFVAEQTDQQSQTNVLPVNVFTVEQGNLYIFERGPSEDTLIETIDITDQNKVTFVGNRVDLTVSLQAGNEYFIQADAGLIKDRLGFESQAVDDDRLRITLFESIMDSEFNFDDLELQPIFAVKFQVQCEGKRIRTVERVLPMVFSKQSNIIGPLPIGLSTFGINSNARTGQGTTIGSTSPPATVTNIINWKQVSCGDSHAVAITQDGQLWSWGRNQNGRTGLGTIEDETLVPTRIGTDSDWAFVSCGPAHNLAIKTNGTLWSWGDNFNGATGQGTTSGNTLVPTQVGTATNWKIVAAGGAHSLGVRTNGQLWAWGRNNFGQFGNGNTLSSAVTTAQRIGTATNWDSVYAGRDASFGIRTSGSLWSWGSNAFGLTALSTEEGNTLTPTQIGSATNWKKLVITVPTTFTQTHVLALTTDGTLWSWGANTNGKTGLGISTGNTLVASQIGNDNDWIDCAAGRIHSLGVKNNAKLYGWGQLGAATAGGFGDRTVPVIVSGQDIWKRVSAGNQFSAAISITANEFNTFPIT